MSPIRLRSAQGEMVQLPIEAAAVEICSTDGKLCQVLIPGKDGIVTVLSHEDDEFHNYAKAVKATVAKTITIN